MAGFWDWLTTNPAAMPPGVQGPPIPAHLLMRQGGPEPQAPAPDISPILMALARGAGTVAPSPQNLLAGMSMMSQLPGPEAAQHAPPKVPGLVETVAPMIAPAAQAVLPERSPILPALTGAVQGPPIPTAPAPTPQKMAFGLAPPAAASTAPRTFTIGPQPAAQPAGDPLQASMALIRQKEGFRDSPYWDVNAHRVGYGSDTITDANGTIRQVKPGDKISREDAERDLSRRTNEFMSQASREVGEENFSKLNPAQQAAITSITYNYGKVPANVAKAIRIGDSEGIAKAVEGLKTDNKGVNAARRQDEANIIRGASTIPTNAFAMPGMPGTPNIQSPNLPIPSPTTPLAGLDPAAFDKFNAQRVIMAPPVTQKERIIEVLAGMAGGAAGAKNIGDLALGAGGGAASAAAKLNARERGELQTGADKTSALNKELAGVEVEKAKAAQQGKNFQIGAGNEDARLLNLVATEQAKLDTAAKNKVAEFENQIDWKKWELFQPQIKADKDGITVIERNPAGGMKVTSHKGQDLDAMADQIKDASTVYGPEVSKQLQYTQLAKLPGGEQQVRRQIMRDAVEGNHLRGILGEENFKKLEKEAEKGLEASLRGKPEEFDKQKKQKMLDLMWSMQPKDETWLPYMLKQGNFGAILMARPQV